jgi:ABC-2 type transport system permease protein
LLIIIVMPILQLILFGYALNMEIQDIPVTVMDNSRSHISRQLIHLFEGSKFFTVTSFSGVPADIDNLFLVRDARVVLMIDKDFDKNYQRQTVTPIQILIDAVDPNAAAIIKNYCNSVVNRFNEDHAGRLPIPFDIKPLIWYNPDMKSAYFFVPGLIALILVMISALLTSITIAREKETGTMEQILVSPVQPIEIITGKVLPYIGLALLDGMLILIIGLFLFDVPFVGSYLLLLLMTLVYITAALSLGLMISTIVRTQQVAMMLALVSTLLPTVMLSGFIFPIKSMPEILQYISYLVPAKYYLIIIRGIMLKGNTLLQLLAPFLFLVVVSAILLRNSLSRFKLTLEK